MPTGSLVVVGTGIKVVGQVTLEARAFMEQAEKLFFLANTQTMAQWIRTLNPTAESLEPFYADGKLRRDSYQEMVTRILAAVRQGLQVCVALYGHPGIFVTPTHEAIRQARREGFSARMLAAVSAADCLFADLGIDPATYGCQSFEATEFLLYQRRPDRSSHLILWQIGVVGILHLQGENPRGVQLLTDRLVNSYGPMYQVVIYEASPYPMIEPIIKHITLSQLPLSVTPMSTLYVPPQVLPERDTVIMAQLGIDAADLVEKLMPDA